MANKWESISQFREGPWLDQVPPALSLPKKGRKMETRKTWESYIKGKVLPDSLLERAEHLKILNERLNKEVSADFRCILNKKWYFNIMYKWTDLKIDIKQEDWVINLAKHTKEILEYIKKEWLEWNNIFSRSRKIINPKSWLEKYLSVYDIFIEKYAIGKLPWIKKEQLTDSEKILINSWYSKRPWLSQIGDKIYGNDGMNAIELARKNEVATDLFVEFLNKINK